jgi:hypothetical protein
MEIVFRLFIIYFFSLSLLPCNEAEAAVVYATVSGTAGQDHGHQHEEDCPPTCTCACCHHYFVKHADKIAAREVIVITHFTIHDISPLAEMDHAVWQPPRLLF